MKRISYLLTFFLSISFQINAQYCWKNSAYETDYKQITSPSLYVDRAWLVNLRNNGLKDLVVDRGSMLYLDLRQPDGTFQPTDSIYFPSGNSSIPEPVFGDINNDGLIDICIEDYKKIYIIGTDNNGHFSNKIDTIHFSYNPFLTSATDWDGDNKKELIIGKSSNNYLNVLQYQSNGNYAKIDSFYCPYKEISWVDMNNDGDDEMYYGLYLYNDYVPGGNLTYQKPIGNQPCKSVFVADFDLDGLKDIFVVKNDSVKIYKNIGNLQFQFHQGIKVNTGDNNTTSVYMEDMNGDNHPELIVQALSTTVIQGSYTLNIFKNNGGTIEATAYSKFSQYDRVMGFDDVNYDGKKDIIVYRSTANPRGLKALLQNKNGGFVGDNTLYESSYSSSADRKMRVKDINNDGLEDVFVYSEKGIKVFGNNGDRTWNYFAEYIPNTSGLSGIAYDFIVDDLNHDGKQDAITPINFNNNIYFFYGLGKSADSIRSITVPGAKYISAGDFNNDSFTDFAIGIFAGSGSVSTPNIKLKINDGLGNFTDFNPFPSGLALALNFKSNGQMNIIDFDNDGDGDIFYTGSTGLLMAKSNGGTSYNLPVLISAAGGNGAFKSADFNNDGYQDLIVNQSSSNVRVLLGSSSGFSLVPVPITNGFVAKECELVDDLDEDGIVDFVASRSGGVYAIFHGNGDGTFAKLFNIEFNLYDFSLISGNFDNDNHKDFAGYNTYQNRISFYYKDSLTFEPTITNLCDGPVLELKLDSSSQWVWFNNSTQVAFRTNPFYVTSSGNYSARLTTNYGCVLYSDTLNVIIANCDSVYPGDTDMDGNCNSDDFLRLGLVYGDTGSSRLVTGNNWQGYYSSNWGASFNNLDKKFADCNGDGTIDLNDTLAISLNYGNAHSRLSNQLLISSNSVNPYYLVIAPGPYSPLDTVLVEVYAGTQSNPVLSAYGLKFSILANDPMAIQPNSISCKFGNSWMGTEDLDFAAMANISGNQISIGLTGIDHLNRNGHGKFAEISFLLSPSLTADTINLGFTDLTLIDANGITQPVSPLVTKIFTNTTTTSTKGSDKFQDFSIFPNPSNENFTLEFNSKKSSEICISIINSMGIEVEHFENANLAKGLFNFQFELNAPGVYFVKLKKDGINNTRKIVKY